MKQNILISILVVLLATVLYLFQSEARRHKEEEARLQCKLKRIESSYQERTKENIASVNGLKSDFDQKIANLLSFGCANMSVEGDIQRLIRQNEADLRQLLATKQGWKPELTGTTETTVISKNELK